MELQDWMAQIRKGTLDMLVLSLLRDREKYGLEIINLLRDRHGLDLAEGTLYPLMNRLRKDGTIIAKWDYNAGTGHPRKYYSLTKSGRELLAGMQRSWRDYAGTIEAVITDTSAKQARANVKQA